MSALKDTGFGSQICACCGEQGAQLTTEAMNFEYGERGRGVVLTAEIPVWTCNACGESYTGEGSEEAELEAICAYLGRLTPTEIVHLRKSRFLTQEGFARKLGVGRVTVARWEGGKQLQSAVYDRLIRDLSATRESVSVQRPQFRTPVEHRRPAAAAFELVPA